MMDERPDPDRLLAEIKEEERAALRGKLEIFFGACAGVGKTYAMLNAAIQRLNEGFDVIVGIAETHGRQETARLLERLPQLPLRTLKHRGRSFKEFDVDAALKRAPQLIIVDELAHTNIKGSKHAKRWQDVEELLAKGIDVYTTLNVQHIESLKDVVDSITGIQVNETLPDHFFDRANDITLVDLPPDELLERLKEGKVYIPAQIERATQNFFRKGNLIALRELALRRTADRVDLQMCAYRANRAISNVWQARERLIACIGPGPSGDKLVRSAARLANELKADWIAVYVETPTLQRLAKTDRKRILDHLKLAEELGAETASLAGSDLIETLIDYARSRNANKLVVGHPTDTPWHQAWRPRFINLITRKASDMDVYVVGIATSKPIKNPEKNPESILGYALATTLCGMATALFQSLDSSHVSAILLAMVLSLIVIGLSIKFGRGPSVWATGLSILLFDFFFVPPFYSFAADDLQSMLVFSLMLFVALIIGQLTAKLRFEATIAHLREQRAQALAALSKELSGALTAEHVVEIANRHVSGMFHAKAATLLPDSNEKIQMAGAPAIQPSIDSAVAQWVYDHQQPAGHHTHTLSAAISHYIPLKAPMRTRGVLALEAESLHFIEEPEEKRLLDIFAAQIALALERVHYVEVAQDALVSMEGERLRNSLLSAISRDLKEPLIALVSLTQTLAHHDPTEFDWKELANAIQNEAQHMSELIANLFDMARLQVGSVLLKKDWQPIHPIVNKACAQLNHALSAHKLKLSIPEGLLCDCDPILIQRVLYNLLDNAAKFTPKGSTISITATGDDETITLIVEDDGPGLPLGEETKLFDKFTRGKSESDKPGIGLGLSLCKIIVEAHEGRISAKNRNEGGASFTIILPIGSSKT